ncbi:hypothetical protein OBBRIDRAFT_892082 [Obba rivulosa]|uniref:Uncharacterized protein n=1 Tax=Obba rivulosa TaxID=1052685 RepID=A0A8E2AG89_9APHY|nr:hypothetical protein OBBRIDRAFT_892082 [Obba rivulosa]
MMRVVMTGPHKLGSYTLLIYDGQGKLLGIINIHIVHSILSGLHRRDLLATMRTCPMLHTEGMKVLLRSEITLYNRTVPGFCTYVLADPTFRGPLLRRISYRKDTRGWYDTAQPSDARALCSVLVHAPNLERLSLLHSAILHWSPSHVYPSILPKLTRLRVLELYGVQALKSQVVREMNSELVSLTLRWDDRNPWEGADMDMIKFCAHSLQTLHLTALPPASASPVSFPSLRELSFDVPSSLSDIVNFIRLCPNIRSFKCRTIPPSTPSEVEASRVRYGQTLTNQCWEHLDHVCLDLSGLYQLNLRQRIRRVDIVIRAPATHSFMIRASTNHNFTWIDTILSDLAPTHLQLNFEEGAAEICGNLPRALKHAYGITHLRLVESATCHVNWRSLFDALQPMKVQHLEVKGSGSVSLAFADQVGKAIPSLNFLMVGTSSYSISRECMPGEVIIQMLDDDVANTMSGVVWG